MPNKQLLCIPAMQTLGLVLTTGCQGPGLGDWVLAAIEAEDGEGGSIVTDYPQVETRGEYTFESGGLLSIEPDGTGRMTLYTNITEESGSSSTEIDEYALATERLERGRWRITTDDDIELMCTSGKALADDADAIPGEVESLSRVMSCDLVVYYGISQTLVWKK